MCAIHVQEKYLIRKDKIVYFILKFSLCWQNDRYLKERGREWTLTAGMTSAGLRRFFVRRQNSINTTRIKMIITKDTDATMILNTGLVSGKNHHQEFKCIRYIRTHGTLTLGDEFFFHLLTTNSYQHSVYLVWVIRFRGYRCRAH